MKHDVNKMNRMAFYFLFISDFKARSAASESDADDVPRVGIEEMLDDLTLEDQEMASDSESD